MSSTTNDVENLPYDEEEQLIEEEQEIHYSVDFISGPTLSEESTLPEDIFEFDFSYGYDCKRFFNLTVADEDVVIFASGNLINFFNVKTKQQWFRRSALGGGIGHITKNPNPNFTHIAIAENGNKPPIIIYDWPSMEIACLLKDGAAQSFSHLNYSPDGMLLASQSGEPDFLITIFNWEKSRIILRTKSNVHEVYRVMFSPDVPGQLTTCGLTHIKFWKMSETFTGLKLQGELGRFGKTEYCDILGIYPMPDEKVVSGTEWGNILIWDEGLIKFEICGKRNKKCHEGPISQFYYADGDLWSVGMDGRIRIWFYDTIDQADPPDDHRFVEVEPSYDFYTPGVMFMCIFKQIPNHKDTFYLAQDGNGGIWRLDLNTDEVQTREPAEQLYRCHSGAVVDIVACPWGTYLASLGIDGRLQLYEYEQKMLLFVHQYPAKGAAIIWLPLDVQFSGNELILGFDDGIVRVVILNIAENLENIKATTIQVVKPHNQPITKMTLNSKGDVLVTGGEDATIFIFKVKKERNYFTFLVPIGYIQVPGIVTCLTWHHAFDTAVLVGCIHGHFLQVKVPKEPQPYTTISYILNLNPKHQRFTTYKAQIQRDIKIREIETKKAIKLERKRKEIEKLKANNPGLEIDEDIFLADSEPEEELEPLHIPDIPNRILWMQTTHEGTIWLSMGGYDAGYIYEYFIKQTTNIPTYFQIIHDGDDIEISSYVYDKHRQYLILAMQDGRIRVVRVNPNDWRDLSDYWQLPMHDNYNGFVPKMLFSYNEKYLFTCGHDGNIFSFRFHPDTGRLREPFIIKRAVLRQPIEVEDTYGYKKLSLEQEIVKAEEDRILYVANEHKKIILGKIKVLRQYFQGLLERNLQLKPSQIIAREELEIDPRITDHLKQRFDADLTLVKKKLEFKVEKSLVGMTKLRQHFTDVIDFFPIMVKGIHEGIYIKNCRQRRLLPRFFDMLDTIEQRIIEDELKNRPPERPPVVAEKLPPVERKRKSLEYFLIGLSPSTIEKRLNPQLCRLLKKYRDRKFKVDKRKREWDAFYAIKPMKGVNHPHDEAALAVAVQTIGDYKLKSAADYKVPQHLRESTVKKYKQLLHIRLKQYNCRNNFNKRLYALRAEKVALRDYLLTLKADLEKIQEELGESDCKPIPEIPEIPTDDFPEDNLRVAVQLLKSNAKPSIQRTKAVVLPPKGGLLENEVLTYLPCTSDMEQNATAPLFLPDDSDPENTDILSQCHEYESQWENETRIYRQMCKLFQQDIVIEKMKSRVKSFDERLILLEQDRLQVLRDGDVVDLHLLTLNQEVDVLKNFESVEEVLQKQVNSKITDLLDMQDLIQEIKNKMDGYVHQIERLQEDEKSIQQTFLASAADSKFLDFLRRIFKKKYKPPKINSPDELSSSSSSESSSSEESEQNDAGSVDSKDFGVIKLDESVCPKGCDQALYDLTFELRNKRHGIEAAVKDLKLSIEALRKYHEVNSKKMRVIDNNLKKSQEELEVFQREKQRKLNEIRCTVILKLHQLQHLVSKNQSEKVGNALIFSQATLSKLYRRVGELHNEILQQRSKHKSNITHMTRMRTDCQHMYRTIKALKHEIKSLMKRKFGQEVDTRYLQEDQVKLMIFGKAAKITIDELQEVQLKKMVFEYRVHHANIKALYEDELILWKQKLREKREELVEKTKENTARLELLAMMNKEKKELARIIDAQPKKREYVECTADVNDAYQKDLNRLTEIVRSQQSDLKMLHTEIQKLHLKGPPIMSQKRKHRFLDKIDMDEEDEYELWSYEVPQTPSLTNEIKAVTSLDTAKTLEVVLVSSIHQVEDMAKSIIMEMLGSLESFHELSEPVLEGLAEHITTQVLQRGTVLEITENLLAYLPEEPSDQQRSIIEVTAEQIFSLHQTDVKENASIMVATGTLEEIIDDVLLIKGAKHDVMANLLSELVKNLPVDFLLCQDSINTIVSKTEHLLASEEDKEGLIQTILNISTTQVEDIHLVLDKVLEMVFGAGIDYLYYIKY